MAKKSTVVYTLDLLVHVEFEEGVSFKDMHITRKDIQQGIEALGTVFAAILESVTIDKTIIQKKVTY